MSEFRLADSNALKKYVRQKEDCDSYHTICSYIDLFSNLSVKSNGDIIDFEGRVVGHIDLKALKGGD